MIENLLNDPRVISRLTVAINSIVALQMFDSRADRPWRYDDTMRMLNIAWNLDITSHAQNDDHYGLISDIQPEANQSLEEVSKLISKRAEKLRNAAKEAAA